MSSKNKVEENSLIQTFNDGNITPTAFAELFFGWKAFDYQTEPLNDMNPRVLMACGRQVGKTEMAAIRALYSSIMNPNTTNLILAPVQRQARILFRRIKFFINLNAQLPKEKRIPITNMIDRETQTEIEWSNGSMLYCLPISEDGCYDKKTEILTPRGWVKFPELKDNDKVAQVDYKNNMTFVKPEEILRTPYMGEMYHLNNQTVDALVTPYHRVVTISRLTGKHNIFYAKDLFKNNTYHYLQNAVRWKGKEMREFSLGKKRIKFENPKKEIRWSGDLYAAFMGIYLAEGCATKYKRPKRKNSYCYAVYISAVKKKERKLIEGLLNKLNIYWHYSENQQAYRICDRKLVEYLRPFGKAKQKYVIDIIKNATPKQINIFLEWFNIGDGHKRNNRWNTRTHSTRLADDLQELYIKVGCGAIKHHYDEGYELYERKTEYLEHKDYTWIGKDGYEKVYYNDYIYCVQVPTGKVLVRRNGKPLVSGNSNIRGHTAHDITIDEAQNVRDPAWAAINPMLATTKGTLRLLGTFYGQNNKFYEWFSLAQRKKACNMWKTGTHFSTYHFPSRVSPLIADSFLQEEAERLPFIEYQQEYEAIPMETVGTLWTETLLKSIIKEDCAYRDYPLQPWRYYLGYDAARFGQDQAVGVILEKRHDKNKEDSYYVVNMFEMEGKSLDYQAKHLAKLHDHWNFEKMIVDTTGVGAGITDTLRVKAYPVEDFNFSIKSKQESFFHATRMLESGTVTLPPHAKLKKQMLEMKREDRSDGFTKIFHPSKTGNDDYPTALVLALWGTKLNRINFFSDVGLSALR